MKPEERFKEKLETFRHDADFYSEELLLDLIEQVVKIMNNTGVSPEELAERMGVSGAAVTRLLRGNTNINLKTMASIAKALGYTININIQAKTQE